MPAELLKAHRALDRAVDKCYRTAPFASDRERVELPFARYEQLVAPLAPAAKPKRPRKKAPPLNRPVATRVSASTSADPLLHPPPTSRAG